MSEFQYGTETIRYQVHWLTTRRTMSIEVHPDQRVVVKAPDGCAEAVIVERLQKRAPWISRQIANFQKYSPKTPPRQYVSGETHLYLGKQYKLKVVVGEARSVKMFRGQLLVIVSDASDRQAVRGQIEGWYREHAKAIFKDTLDVAMGKFKSCAAPRLIVRTMQSRWGSLSPTGTMTININLIRAPRSCIEYVITHELCHTKHRHHDARFYKLLSRLMPDWQGRKQRLEQALL